MTLTNRRGVKLRGYKYTKCIATNHVNWINNRGTYKNMPIASRKNRNPYCLLYA